MSSMGIIYFTIQVKILQSLRLCAMHIHLGGILIDCSTSEQTCRIVL